MINKLSSKRIFDFVVNMENVNIKEFLNDCISIVKPTEDEYDSLSQLIEESKKFPIKFPIETVRCEELSKTNVRTILDSNIESTYPLIHEKVFMLYCEFLFFKRRLGSNVERELYKEMGVVQLVDRLLKKRAIMFMGPKDHYLLPSGRRGTSGWEEVGTPDEVYPLVLADCLSYDEMKLSALLYVSGHTAFINDGARNNGGKPESDWHAIERDGNIIGMIGTRLCKPNVMEYQEMMITKEQNTIKNGYGEKQEAELLYIKCPKLKKNIMWRSIWSKFYDEPMFTYEEARNICKDRQKNDKTLYQARSRYFNSNVYAKHIQLAIDCCLAETQHRAGEHEKFAYLHVVGIGLGVWRALPVQDCLFVMTFIERISKLIYQLPGISDIHFSYIKDLPPDFMSPDGVFIKSDTHPKGGIQIHLSNREPSSKLVGPHQGMLLVETYAWDGNAQPGNEFWIGKLNTSGDPAAACSSQVAELHNSLINTRFVSGNNLHVVCNGEVLHISEYATMMINNVP